MVTYELQSLIETPNNNEICCELRHIFSQKLNMSAFARQEFCCSGLFFISVVFVPSHNNNSFEILAREFKTIFGFLWSCTWPFWCDCDQSKNGHLECDFTFSTLRVQMCCNVTFDTIYITSEVYFYNLKSVIFKHKLRTKGISHTKSITYYSSWINSSLQNRHNFCKQRQKRG